jgi:hypothetical protein
MKKENNYYKLLKEAINKNLNSLNKNIINELNKLSDLSKFNLSK